MTFHGSMNARADTAATVRRGDPIALDASGVPVGEVAWGHLRVADTILSLVLERGAPPLRARAVGAAGQVALSAAGLGQIQLDVEGYRDYGNGAVFSLSRLHAVAGVHAVAVTLCLDAPEIRAGADYTGELSTSIGEIEFPAILSTAIESFTDLAIENCTHGGGDEPLDRRFLLCSCSLSLRG